MSTMEYCAFENSAADMRVAVDKLNDLSDLSDLNEYELRGFKSLRKLCQQFIDASEDMEPAK